MKQYGKSLVLSSAEPARNGYVFIGWAESPGASSAQFEPGDTFTGNKDLSLYAVWQIAHQHSLTHISEKPATETSEGNIEHWYCNGCGKYFSDAKAVNEISQSQTVLTKLKHIHSLTAYPEVASTCTKGGNLAYWCCGECGKYYSDSAGNNETSDSLVTYCVPSRPKRMSTAERRPAEVGYLQSAPGSPARCSTRCSPCQTKCSNSVSNLGNYWCTSTSTTKKVCGAGSAGRATLPLVRRWA